MGVEKEEEIQQAPVHLGILDIMSRDQIRAAKYFERKKIFDLFNFLIGHLLVDAPAAPIAYLEDLLTRCLVFRDRGGPAPLLFTPAHIAALYRAFDPSAVGTISLEQYRTAMMTMGICGFKRKPPVDGFDRISRVTFCDEAEHCARKMLLIMVGGAPAPAPLPPCKERTSKGDLPPQDYIHYLSGPKYGAHPYIEVPDLSPRSMVSASTSMSSGPAVYPELPTPPTPSSSASSTASWVTTLKREMCSCSEDEDASVSDDRESVDERGGYPLDHGKQFIFYKSTLPTKKPPCCKEEVV